VGGRMGEAAAWTHVHDMPNVRLKLTWASGVGPPPEGPFRLREGWPDGSHARILLRQYGRRSPD
jgi:hypothetical protein